MKATNAATGVAPSQPGECLAQRVGGLTGASVERRHEELMEWAERELRIERSYAEQVYTIAEEEQLQPIYGFLLIQCGIGVIELEAPEAPEDDEVVQQAPPGMVGDEEVQLEDVDLERRLRSTFRRFRGHLEAAASPVEAAATFSAEPDVGPLRLC